jgi:hypothetical protein
MPASRHPGEPLSPAPSGTSWIDELTDEQCMEIFWLYVEPPEPFLERYPPALLGKAMRFALRAVALQQGGRRST